MAGPPSGVIAFGESLRYGSAMSLRLRRERFVVGLRGLALLRGWPFQDSAEADVQLDAVREALTSREGSGAPVVEAEPLDTLEAYAWWSETYDGPNPLIDAEEPVVRDFLAGIEPGRALDVAAGTGRLARMLDNLGHRVVAVDASAEMLHRARQNAVGVALALGDVRALPIRDACADVVTCALALTHVRSLDEPIAELARMLRPGGHLLLSDIHPVAVVTGAHAFFVRRDGTRGVTRNELHWPSEYVEAFRSADLLIERAAEPPFDATFAEEISDAAVRDAAREALVGLPFALVWLAAKPV
jgi:ubiquinone/menaquinone biosynthesis C-methylase UbiE